MSKPIDKLLDIFEEDVKSVGTIKHLENKIQRIIHTVQMDSISRHKEGYCMTFRIPRVSVNQIFDDYPSINFTDIKSAFMKQWEIPITANMYSDEYYHSLSFIIIYALRNRNEALAKNALILILFKIWNGRRIKGIQYCNPDIMDYVVSNMMSKKYLPTKYDNPLELILKHFAPTLINKYKQNVIRDSTKSKRLFEQCYVRVNQLFKSSPAVDLLTKKTSYKSGLQSLYFQASKANLRISTLKINQDIEGFDIDTVFSGNPIEAQISSFINYITVNSSPKYDNNFISFINKDTHHKTDTIIKILHSIHTLGYADLIREISELFFKRLQHIGKNDICAKNFLTVVIRKRIISSKHTTDITHLKKLIDKLLSDILMTKFSQKYDYFSWSDVRRSQFRRVVIYGIAYNLQKFVCFSGH